MPCVDCIQLENTDWQDYVMVRGSSAWWEMWGGMDPPYDLINDRSYTFFDLQIDKAAGFRCVYGGSTSPTP
jgi:hypothetical protein